MARQARHSARHLFWRGMVAAASNAAMVSGLYPVAPHLGMMLERRRRRDHVPRPRAQLRSMATEWAVSLAMSAARPVGFLGLRASARTPRGPRPIITVHGYAMSRSCFLPLARRLVRAQLGPVLGFEYWSLGSVASAARRLGAYVDAVCQETGHERVDIVGHSMGGVVGRYYVTLRDGSPRVRNLVTIGSPHQGTEISYIGLGRPHKELMAGSNLIERLHHSPVPRDTHLTVVWSRSDALVWGERHARIANVDEIVFEDLGHVTMLVSPRVARLVIDVLGRR